MQFGQGMKLHHASPPAVPVFSGRHCNLQPVTPMDTLPFSLPPSLHAILFIGIQASCKTTFYNSFLAGSHVHVSLDVLGTRRREKDLLAACMARRVSFAVDDTNLTADVRRTFIAPAKAAGYYVTGLFFRSVIAESAARNALREGKARIPSHAIAASSNKLELPSPAEGFDSLWYVSVSGSGWQISEWRME